MANQPTPMVPSGNEKSPDILGSSLHFERMNPSTGTPETPEVPSSESNDQSQADAVREKLISESAGIAQTTPTLTTLRTQATSTVSQGQQFASLAPEDQVNQLLNVAHASGLNHAFKLANATNNAYVIDRFHDELVNRVLHNKQQSM